MDPANAREALHEVLLDVDEGADMIMVKPAGPYLDVIRRVREAVNIPVVAYQVSGEYSLLKAAAERGWIDERAAALETLVGIKRAGADLILSYFAPQIAGWLGTENNNDSHSSRIGSRTGVHPGLPPPGGGRIPRCG